MRRFMVGKERFLFKSFLGLAEKQLFFRKTPLDFTMVTYYLNPSFSDPPPPFQCGSSFLYTVVWIASQPFTWKTIDLSLDTCPITCL